MENDLAAIASRAERHASEPWYRAEDLIYEAWEAAGPLRQYFSKGSGLAVHGAVDLGWVATELNDRPRKRLAFAKPIEEIAPLLLR